MDEAMPARFQSLVVDRRRLDLPRVARSNGHTALRLVATIPRKKSVEYVASTTSSVIAATSCLPCNPKPSPLLPNVGYP